MFLYVKKFDNRFYNDTCFELIEKLGPNFCYPMATSQGCNNIYFALFEKHY
jgi:hypothetical protein